MRIPELPQVEFDSFPTDENTKVCIFTKLPYPIPDLSHVNKDERKLVLYCTESTALTIGRFAKKLPIELFIDLPTGTTWLLIDGTIVDGLETPFRVACLPTGSVSDSVMLMIFLINDPKKIILYTGAFQKCREVLISNFFIKYKKFMSDIYIDNTFANSKHLDIIQDARACDDIKKIVDAYPNHKIHLQMEMFATMDLLVELAQRHRINVKLDILQQIFFYKSQYKHLFYYDARIPKAADLNKNFLFKNQPEVYIVSYEAADVEAYKMYFRNKKIITIRLIASERYIDVTSETIKKGLVYITYAGHAGTTTLHSLIHAIQPKRIHPIFDDSPDDNPMSRIPAEILNEDCAILYDTWNQSSNENCLEVTLDDMRPAPKQHSFLHLTTVLPNDIISESEPISGEQISKSFESNQNQTIQSSDESADDEPVIIEISDDESDTVEAMCRISNKKRPPPPSNISRKSKYFKPNDENCNEVAARPMEPNDKHLKSANLSNCLNETTKAVYNDEDDDDGDGDDDDLSSLTSFEQLIFPTD